MPSPEQSLPTPALPCPQCREMGVGGAARIGNNRTNCSTCNNFAQNVMRLTRTRLKERYPDEYYDLRIRAELDLYPQVIEDYTMTHPTRSDA